MPVIAVFTKFDDLVAQLYDRDREEEENHTEASKVVTEKFEMPLKNSRDRPKGYVCFEGAFIYLLFQALPSEHLFQRLMMTKVIIKSKWRVWLRKPLLLLMTSPLRCYLSLSSETTLNYASNMLYMSELLLWELSTAMVIHFISDGTIWDVQSRYVGNRVHRWLMLTFQWGHGTLRSIMVQALQV